MLIRRWDKFGDSETEKVAHEGIGSNDPCESRLVHFFGQVVLPLMASLRLCSYTHPPAEPFSLTFYTPVMKRTLLLPLAALLLLAGCIQTQATLLDGTTYPPVHEDDVIIYLNEEDIPADWKPIAIIHAQGEAQWTNESQMLRKARKRAGGLGANGLLIEDIDEPSAVAQVAGEVFGTGTTRRGRLVAIRVFDQ